MKRWVYLNAVYVTGLGYELEVTRSGRVYVREDGHLQRADAMVTRTGMLAISGPHEQAFTLRPDMTLVVHGDQEREVRPLGEKQKEHSA
jgi:hypothetical protein